MKKIIISITILISVISLLTGFSALAYAETLYLDTHLEGEVFTTEILENDVEYLITVEGTFSVWSTSQWGTGVCKGSTEPSPIFESPDTNNGVVSHDAAYISAYPKTSPSLCPGGSPAYDVPFKHENFRISVDNGNSWSSLDPEETSFQTNHVYHYTVVGNGTPAQLGFYFNDGIYTDNYGMLKITVERTNQPPVAEADGPYLIAAEQSVSLNGSESSDPDGDPLTETWTETGSPTLGSISGSTFTAGSVAGITEVTLTVDDGYGGTATDTATVVIYDPSAGFVTGGGWIYSNPGAYKPQPSLEGKANFGFVAKYMKGAEVPEGNTEFQFHAGDLNFNSSSYDWLVVTGSDYAIFKGTGTINGGGNYKFKLWAGDKEPDTFRIKIWEEDEFGVEMVIYDNGMDQAIGGGSIVIHTKNK